MNVNFIQTPSVLSTVLAVFANPAGLFFEPAKLFPSYAYRVGNAKIPSRRNTPGTIRKGAIQ
jgi:hypothetical protein